MNDGQPANTTLIAGNQLLPVRVNISRTLIVKMTCKKIDF